MFARGPRPSTDEQRRKIKVGSPNYDLPGIPHAIQRRKLNEADKEFEKKKKKLASRLEIATHRLPYHLVLIHQLSNEGHCKASMELQMITRQEESLVCDKELLKTIADSLKYSWDLIDKEQSMMAISIRRTVAEYLLKFEDKVWLSKHMYQTILDLSIHLKDQEMSNKIKSETKCLLGYLEQISARNNNESTMMKQAILLLEEVRNLSKGQIWTFQSKILIITLKKPICFLGLRQECEDVVCHSLKIFDVATLLLYEIFLSRTCQMIFPVLRDDHLSLSPSDLSQAMEFGERALLLAKEINQPTALSTAYMILGTIYRKMGHFEKASDNFRSLQKLAYFRRDHETETVAFNLLGRCYIELNDPVTGLDMFACQREISELHNLKDLEADALQHMGLILLEEGQRMESELCYMEAYDRLLQFDPSCVTQGDLGLLTTHAWAMKGIAAGSNLWPRFAGHCRHGQGENFDQIWNWKTNRIGLKRVPPVTYKVPVLYTDIFTNFEDLESKIPKRETTSIVDSIVAANKNLLPHDMFRLPMDENVQAVMEKQEHMKAYNEEEDQEGKEVHFKVENIFQKPQRQREDTMMVDSLDYTIFSKEFDEGLVIDYETDLTKTIVVRESSDQGQGGDTVDRVHIISGGGGGIHRGQSYHSPKASVSPTTTTHPPVHGGISMLDVVARPSLNFNISSLSRNNSWAYESHSQLHDYKTKYSVDLSVQRRKSSYYRRQSKIRLQSIINKPTIDIVEKVTTSIPKIDSNSNNIDRNRQVDIDTHKILHHDHHHNDNDKGKHEAFLHKHKLTSHMGTHLMVLPQPLGPGSKILSDIVVSSPSLQPKIVPT